MTDPCPKCNYPMAMFLENPHLDDEPPTWPVRCCKCGHEYSTDMLPWYDKGRRMQGDVQI